MNQAKNNGATIVKRISAGISGTFKGRVSHFNQFLIISSISLIVLICVFIPISIKFPQFFPILYLFVWAFVILLVAGFLRYCLVKPTDEDYPITTKIMAMSKAIEIKNAPASLITQEFIAMVSSMQFFQNEPPKGLIEGEVTDKKAIKMLSEEEREEFSKKEGKDIIQHQKIIVDEVVKLKLEHSVNPPKVETTSTDTNSGESSNTDL